MDAEIKNLLDAVHIRKIDKITDEMLIQPVVITVEKDRSNKIALDARSVNNVILKTKYHLPDLESLMGKIASRDNKQQERKRGPFYVTGYTICVRSNRATRKYRKILPFLN